jgi:hypothetical protein
MRELFSAGMAFCVHISQETGRVGLDGASVKLSFFETIRELNDA